MEEAEELYEILYERIQEANDLCNKDVHLSKGDANRLLEFLDKMQNRVNNEK